MRSPTRPRRPNPRAGRLGAPTAGKLHSAGYVNVNWCFARWGLLSLNTRYPSCRAPPRVDWGRKNCGAAGRRHRARGPDRRGKPISSRAQKNVESVEGISADGELLAYTSGVTGRTEVYVYGGSTGPVPSGTCRPTAAGWRDGRAREGTSCSSRAIGPGKRRSQERSGAVQARGAISDGNGVGRGDGLGYRA